MTTAPNSPCRRIPLTRVAVRLAAIGIAALTAVAVVAPPASAAGGTSIASAPLLAPGVLQTGGGNTQEFWRIQLYAGDRMTVQAQNDDPDSQGGDEFDLFNPSVTDYTLNNSQPVNPWHYGNDDLPPGKNQFTLTSPFTGAGTIDICDPEDLDTCPQAGNLSAPAFSFTVFVAHLTAISVSGPRYAKPGSRVRITGRVSSPAGTPTGACSIDGHFAGLRNGVCSRRVRLGNRRREIIDVQFLPNGGWQSSSARQTIHIIKP